VLAEETSDPRRNVPRAVIGAVVTTGIFYLLVSYATAIGIVFGCVALLGPGTRMAVAGVRPEAVDQNTGGLAAFDYLAVGTPAVMFCYLLLGLAGLREGRRTGNRCFAGLGTAAALTGATALYGSLYYSFATEPSSSSVSFPSWFSCWSVRDWCSAPHCAPRAAAPGKRWDSSSRNERFARAWERPSKT
jgi:hypothetical protein